MISGLMFNTYVNEVINTLLIDGPNLTEDRVKLPHSKSSRCIRNEIPELPLLKQSLDVPLQMNDARAMTS